MKLGNGAKVVVATHNSGKLQEFIELLAPMRWKIISAQEIKLAEPEETGNTFADNATLKANAAAVATGLPALADDSGLAVDTLNGAPGIYSARWAGPQRDFTLAMTTVEKQLQAAGAVSPEQRRAHFICALCLAVSGTAQVWEGRVSGSLVWPPRGDNGFGYDPMFLPDGYLQTFGEMVPALKHGISHRAKAFNELRNFWK